MFIVSNTYRIGKDRIEYIRIDTADDRIVPALVKTKHIISKNEFT